MRGASGTSAGGGHEHAVVADSGSGAGDARSRTSSGENGNNNPSLANKPSMSGMEKMHEGPDEEAGSSVLNQRETLRGLGGVPAPAQKLAPRENATNATPEMTRPQFTNEKTAHPCRGGTAHVSAIRNGRAGFAVARPETMNETCAHRSPRGACATL